MLIIVAIVLVLIVISMILNHYVNDSLKIQEYETGFDPISVNPIMGFNFSFYNIAILFLIFDLELILLYPYCTISYNSGVWGYTFFYLILLILLIGLIVEVRRLDNN